MSTPYFNIFKKFHIEVTDINLLSNLTDIELTELLEIFLNKSKSIYFKICKKNLADIENYDYYTKTFIADGEINTFVINKYPNNPHIDAIELICKVNDIDISTYTFDEENLTFTIESELVEKDIIECGYLFSGQFNEDLNLEEEFILLEGMKLTWLERQLYKEEKLRNKIGTKDYNSFSPGNLIGKLIELRNVAEIDLKQKIVDYSFNEFSGFN
jgi:hypothetical protein